MPPVLSLALGTGLRWGLQGRSTQQVVAVLTGTSGPEASLWSQAHPLRSPPHAWPLPLRTPVAVQPEPTPVGQGASRAPHALGRPALNMRFGHAQRRRPHLTHQDRPPRAHRVAPLSPCCPLGASVQKPKDSGGFSQARSPQGKRDQDLQAAGEPRAPQFCFVCPARRVPAPCCRVCVFSSHMGGGKPWGPDCPLQGWERSP